MRMNKDTESKTVARAGNGMDIDWILTIMPHRYPFLLIDRVLEVEEGNRVIGIKNVTINEPFFVGHFPSRPVMPGVLILEALAQLSGVLMLKSEGKEGKLAYFMAIDKAKFRRAVRPGDQLRLEAEVLKMKGRLLKTRVQALVEGDVACQAEMMFQLVE
jgi:3-hydroxyacyl-[acyl-carrier-protein] dehydratase